MQCSVHRGKIRGRIHFWNHQPMCSCCYARFTSRVHLIRRKVPNHRPPKRGFWQTLWSLL